MSIPANYKTVTILSKYDYKTAHQRTFLVAPDLYKEYEAVMKLRKKGNHFVPDSTQIDQMFRSAGTPLYGENAEIILFNNGRISQEQDWNTEGVPHVFYTRYYKKNTGKLESGHYHGLNNEHAYYRINSKKIVVEFSEPKRNGFNRLVEKFKSIEFHRSKDLENNVPLFLSFDHVRSNKEYDEVAALSDQIKALESTPSELMTDFDKQLHHISKDVRKFNAWANADVRCIDVSSLNM